MIWIRSHVLLQANEQSNQDEIKQAHRRMIKHFHPDINIHPAANEMTKALNEAMNNMMYGNPGKIVVVNIEDEKHYSIMNEEVN